MQRLQLYIEGNLIDLFEDEIVELTSTIQDIRDIGKVFTDYSQNFNVPASDTNNKIFRHYYNFNITGNAYDSRKKKQAEIHINYMPFRKGKIFLNGVKMKMNKPYAYDITFYGNMISLKDLIGDDELTDLTYLSNYNHEYSETNVRNGFTSGLNLNNQTESIIYPLITSKKRLYFHSSLPDFNADGNIYHDTSNSNQDVRGLEYTDLKPAIRAIHVIEAIENQYNIEFTRNFFSSSAFSNLFLWINNKKGEFNDIDDDEGHLFSHTLSGYAFQSSPTGSPESVNININGSEISLGSSFGHYELSLDLTVSNQNIPYKVVFRDKTRDKENTIDALGDGTFDFSLIDAQNETETLVIEIEIQSESEFTISGTDLEIKFTSSLAITTPPRYIYSFELNQTTTADIFLDKRLPKLKVMDFLSGLFNMFNLTAYYIDDIGDYRLDDSSRIHTDGRPLIYIDTLDNFYSDAINNPLDGLIDIDKYVDITEHQVNSTLPFTDIEFKYEETNTVLMENHFEQFNEVFGDAEFNVRREFPDKIDRGTKYKIKLPFSHMKYERLLDLNIASSAPTRETLIQCGYCAGGEFDADADATPAPTGDYNTISIKPLLFYGIKLDNLPVASVSNNFRDGRINWISTSPPTGITSYWRPSNSNDTGNPTTPPTHSINFDQEFDEFQRINYGDKTNSLYKSFYKSYVESIFNIAKRLYIVTAHLPPSVLVNYRMNDQIKIQDMVFRINSITTNLNTGKTELELLNIFSYEIVE